MLYAKTNDKGAIPLGWEEVEHLWNKFCVYGARMHGYQLDWEQKMFALQEGAEIRACLRKWETPRKYDRSPTVEDLLVTDDPKQMAAVLFMLVNDLEANGRHQWFSTDRTNGTSWT